MRHRPNPDIDTQPFPADRADDTTQRMPCLTILAHPEPAMVGARAFLGQLQQGGIAGLSRLSPEFTTADGQHTQPIGDPYASRQPTMLTWRDGVVLTPCVGESRVVVAGQPLTLPRHVERNALERGVVLEISNRTALLLHLRTLPQAVAACGLIGGSEALDKVRQQIALAAPLAVPVLVTGETGVGKELVARALHETSPRRDGPWVAVNVAEITAETAASALFGHMRGAIAGAAQDHDGLFAQANGGTLFLDEVGEMAPDVQAMLLRVLETGEVQRLGDHRVRKVDVRVVAATDQDLDERSLLRTPLLYRLAGYHVRVPALRQRLEDLGALLAHFRDEELALAGRPVGQAWIPAGLVAQLATHKWPGNARELRNLVRTLVIQADGDERLGNGFSLETWLGAHRITEPRTPMANSDPSALTDEAVATALTRNRWSLTATARELGIARSTLYLLIDRSTTLRTAGDVTPAELRAAQERSGGDIDAMAQLLHVSPRGLRLALRGASIAGIGVTTDDRGLGDFAVNARFTAADRASPEPTRDD